MIQTYKTITGNFNITVSSESWEAFQMLIQRGSNLWPDAPPEIKELADIITNGEVMQDYKKHANVESLADVAYQPFNRRIVASQFKTASHYHTFAGDVAKFNKMYGMGSFTLATTLEAKERLKQFQKMILDELKELSDIIDQLDYNAYDTQLDMRVDLADLLGDLQVFCASEMLRWDIPIPDVLSIIMQSNFLKLQADGTALFVDGKLQKGPDYWRPEPKIFQLLVSKVDQS